ncbi:vomeronasal type-2 receptor 26-like [Mantella aurantiaca]
MSEHHRFHDHTFPILATRHARFGPICDDNAPFLVTPGSLKIMHVTYTMLISFILAFVEALSPCSSCFSSSSTCDFRHWPFNQRLFVKLAQSPPPYALHTWDPQIPLSPREEPLHMAPSDPSISVLGQSTDCVFKIPVSTCSKDCALGYRRVMKRGTHRCCFECVPCAVGEISNETDKGSCHKCSEDKWPNDNNQCVSKPIEFLSYSNDPAVLTVSVISVVLFFKTSAIFCVFIVFRETPVVRANNQNLSFILLVSIMLSFLCVFLFLGRPERVSCMFRQTSFGIIFSVAVSSILAKTIMVYMAFKATKPGSYWRKYIGVKIPNCLVLLCSFFQVLISLIWLLTACPYPETNTDLYADKIIIQCNEGSTLAFSLLLGYLGLLAAVSFFVAFLARNLPDSFNEAKFITFSMLVLCSVWITFIPAYMNVTGKNTVLVEIFAIIASSWGILGCIFIPKCYIILVRPELNSKIKLIKQTKTCH